jgi:hypothetical protein
MADRIVTNIVQYTTGIIPQSMMPWMSDHAAGISKLVGVMMIALLVIGCVRNFFRPTRLLSVYAFFYGGILSMWQAQWSSGRFLSGILPILFFLMFSGITAIVEFFTTRERGTFIARLKSILVPLFLPIPKIIVGIVVLLSLLVAIDSLTPQLQRPGSSRRLTADWVNFFSCADWIRLNTPKDAIIMSRKPEHVYIRSHRQGTLYAFSQDKEKVIAEMKTKNVSYILFDNFFWTGTTGRYLYPVLLAHPEMYRVAYALKNPDTYVLEVIK